MMYAKIIEAIKAENAKYLTQVKDYIAQREEVLQRCSTPTRWTQYKAGKISREKCAEYAIEREERQTTKREAAELAEAETIAAAPEVTAISIYINWTRSSGTMNPHAQITVYTDRGTYDAAGSAYGGNYDKESAAIATALNKIPAALKIIYDQRENDIEIYGTRTTSARPKYESGTGVNQIRRILEASHIEMKVHDETKTTDHYYFEKA